MATSYAEAEGRSVSIGRIFSRAFGTMGANPLAVFGISFLLGGLPQGLIKVAVRGAQLSLAQTGGIAAFAAGTLISVVVALICSAIVQGGVIRATLAHAEGQEAGIGDCIVTGLRASLPMLALTLLFAIAVALGLLLLIVPGIMLMVIWSAAPAALVADRAGVFGSFGRSAALTSGARWRVFGAGVLFLVLYYIVAAVIGTITLSLFGFQSMVAAAANPGIGFTLFNVAASTVLLAYFATVQSSLYVELRDWKDGPRVDRLAEIFS